MAIGIEPGDRSAAGRSVAGTGSPDEHTGYERTRDRELALEVQSGHVNTRDSTAPGGFDPRCGTFLSVK